MPLVFLLCFYYLCFHQVHANFTIFTPQVDAALELAPGWLWDTFAGLGIAFGTIFAFAGARMLRTAGFLFGAFVGALLAALVLALIGTVQSSVWIGVVISTAFVFGVISAIILSLARFVMIIALGVSIAGVFVQYCLSYIQHLPSWVLYLIIGVSIVAVAIITWKIYAFAMILATSFIGGFVVLLCVARFTQGPISLAGMWANPTFLQSCITINCWGPFIAGLSVCVLGLIYQLKRAKGRGVKKDKKTKRELEASEKARKQEQERFEERIREIRRTAEEEVNAATEQTRRIAEGAKQEKEALLRETRILEEEKEKIRQARKKLEVEAQLVEAEFVESYHGNVDDLPVADDVPQAPAQIKRMQFGIPGSKKTSRPARPPRPSDHGWGSGPRPWNKCPTHQMTYDQCGCTNPRSKEQVLKELENLRLEKQRFEQEQRFLEIRNQELKTRLLEAEQNAAKASSDADMARVIAEQQVLKSAAVSFSQSKH